MKDLRSRLSKVKEFVVVDQRPAATLVLTVLGRGVGSEAYGQRIQIGELFGRTEITNAAMYDDTFWIATVLEAGDYRRTVTGTLTREGGHASLGAWSYCADQIVKDVRQWAQANADTLSQRKP